jgi:hypothetical protein
MAVFIDFWPCLFASKLSYAQLFKWGHSNPPPPLPRQHSLWTAPKSFFHRFTFNFKVNAMAPLCQNSAEVRTWPPNSGALSSQSVVHWLLLLACWKKHNALINEITRTGFWFKFLTNFASNWFSQTSSFIKSDIMRVMRIHVFSSIHTSFLFCPKIKY